MGLSYLRRGDQRRISIFKTKQNTDTMKGKDVLSCFKFSEEAKYALQDLFTRYPPGDGETNEPVVGKHSKKFDKLRGKKDDMFCKPVISTCEIAKRVESFASRIEKSPNMRQVFFNLLFGADKYYILLLLISL